MDKIVVQPLHKPINLPIFAMPEDFQETAKKNLRRMMRMTTRELNEAKDKQKIAIVDYLNIVDPPKINEETRQTYENIWEVYNQKCSELDSKPILTTLGPSSGQSNIPIGVVDTEKPTQLLSLTVTKKRTSSDNGQKPQILMLKNASKLLSLIDSHAQHGTNNNF